MNDLHPPLTTDELTRIVTDASRLWDQLPTDGGPSDKTGILSSRFTASWPRACIRNFVAWFGRRLIFWPTGIQQAHRISIVSSRLGKRKDLKAWWFDGLRTSVLRCDHATECLCVVEGTSAENYVVRGSELFGVPRLRIRFAETVVQSETGLVEWCMESQAKASSFTTSELETHAWISPQLLSGPANNFHSTSLPDEMLTFAGERIVSLSCRQNGNVESALCMRLQEAETSPPIVLLAATEHSPEPPENVVDLGGIPWYLDAVPDKQSVSSGQKQPVNESKIDSTDSPLISANEWLCHWTRPAFGPWLDQPADDFIDELILGCESADRSAVAALLRIVSQQKLLATVASHGELPTVSLTAVPLAEFRSRRIYRRHKQHYDFEPWGIAIRRSAVQQLNGEAVVYQSDLPNNQRNDTSARFTQPQFDRSKAIDWSEEREWRIEGNVFLSDISADDVCVFVDSEASVSLVQKQCPWRILVVPDKRNC